MVIYSFDSDIFLFCFVCDAIVQSEMYTRCVCVYANIHAFISWLCANDIWSGWTTNNNNDRERQRENERQWTRQTHEECQVWVRILHLLRHFAFRDNRTNWIHLRATAAAAPFHGWILVVVGNVTKSRVPLCPSYVCVSWGSKCQIPRQLKYTRNERCVLLCSVINRIFSVSIVVLFTFFHIFLSLSPMSSNLCEMLYINIIYSENRN